MDAYHDDPEVKKLGVVLALYVSACVLLVLCCVTIRFSKSRNDTLTSTQEIRASRQDVKSIPHPDTRHSSGRLAAGANRCARPWRPPRPSFFVRSYVVPEPLSKRMHGMQEVENILLTMLDFK